ncbi:gamma-glutamyltransferase family protein [Natronosalvus halobius]|uniref:gamma-glutamyltransferase family protein n=1 Tax=Natronosalvus halobius TaxID=2953746 RepID=UPI00209DBC8A|nr:gamma-glutamyltransferase family protein [Natronosalvus halobius]USZ73662.1 gamma-glutamyltransferase family protein [Natronosalvus halobius]
MDIGHDLDTFESRRSTVYAPNGVVATSQPLAASAGLAALRNGGNAFDAAISAAAALNVVEPTSTGIGGDAFALYRTADGTVGGIRSCGHAPADATIETVRTRLAVETNTETDSVTMPERGPHTVTVPGTARGWELMVERFGRLSLSTVLEPAIEYAFGGYPVSETIASYWTGAEELFEDANARKAYLFDGQAPKPGEVVRLEALGRTLQTIAEEGADAVYEGEIADAIVDAIQSRGGLLSKSDLASFSPELIDPISTSYGGVDVFQLPPSNQGTIALEALNIASAIDAGDAAYETPDRIHLFAEATKRAFEDGHQYIADPEYEEIPPLNSPSYARQRARSIRPKEATDVSFGIPDSNAEDADTVLVCAADVAGNVVSFINSRFMGFGSGIVAGDTGIALQNRGASFSLDPADPNRLEPGKRPFHTLMPSVVKFARDDWAAFGVVGGYMQPQGQVQILSNLIDYGMDLQPALDAPRWRYRVDGSLGLEARTSAPLQSKLVRWGHDVRVEIPAMFGGAQIARVSDDVLSGASEPRTDGMAIGY